MAAKLGGLTDVIVWVDDGHDDNGGDDGEWTGNVHEDVVEEWGGDGHEEVEEDGWEGDAYQKSTLFGSLASTWSMACKFTF